MEAPTTLEKNLMLVLTADIRTTQLTAVTGRFYPSELTKHPEFNPELLWATDEIRGKASRASHPKTIVIDDVAWRGYEPWEIYGPATWQLGNIKLTLAIDGEMRSSRFNRKLSIAMYDNAADDHLMKVFEGLGYLLEDGTMVITGAQASQQDSAIGLMRLSPPRFTVHQPDLERKTA